MPDETAIAFQRRADAVKAGEIVGMVEASAGKPPLTAEQQAERDAEKASDMRIKHALLARAASIDEKWKETGSASKRSRSEEPEPAVVGADNCMEIIKMIAETMEEAGIERSADAWNELAAAMKVHGNAL